MVHIRKEKGDIGSAMVIADLTVKGYAVLMPVVNEHLPFDMIAYKDGKSARIQAKYNSAGNICSRTVWNDKHGTHIKTYNMSDFDYYGLYLPEINKVVYPSITFGGLRIATKIPNSATKFWWWEDFQDLTNNANKRHYKDFGVELTHSTTQKTIESAINRRKVTRPSKDELLKLLWEKPMTHIAKDFGVSNKAIEKWSKAYDISGPPKGWWNNH